MQKNGKKYEINSFIANSRLIKSLPPTSFSIEASQVQDIKCKAWSFFFLTMQYHIKFARYIENKLTEIQNKCDISKLMVIVLIENTNTKEQVQKFSEVQMICLKKGVKVMPCFTIEEARGVLQDFYHSQTQ